MGRAPNAMLRLDDPLVSGRHAILFIKDGALHIADQGSSNGVFVNGHRVSTAPVGPLDEIRIGDSRLKIESIGDMVDDEIPSPERTHAGLEISIGPDLAASAPGTIELSPELAPAVPPPAPLPTPPPPPAAGPDPVAEVAAAPTPPMLPGAKAKKPREDSKPPARPEASAAAPAERSSPHATTGHDTAAPAERSAPHAAEVHDAVPLPPPPPAPSKRPAKQKRGSNIAAMLLETNEELALSEAKKESPPPAVPAPVAAADDGLPYPPSPPEVDEEAEEERRFTAPFSLLDLVVLDKGDPGRGATLAAEVLRHRGDRLVDATRLDGGATYEIYRGEDAKAWRMLQVLRGGKIRLFFREGDEGTILVGNRKTTLSSFCDDAHLFHKKRRIYALELTESDRAQLWIDGAGYFVRLARAPLPPPKKLSLRVSPEDRRYLMVGVAGIVLMLAGIWVQSLLAPPELLVMEQAEFAEISLKDLEMEKPPEPEPPPKVPEPPAEVQAPTPEPAKPAPPRPTKTPPARVARGNPKPSPAPAPSAADSALAALADIAPAGDTKLTAAVSNIAAVRAPSGTSSSFQVSGAIGKVPGDEVTLSRGGKAGGEGRETRAASAVLAGKSVGQVAGGGGTGRVRGTVSRQPARSVGTSGGSLDRGAILKVINEHLSQVQSCYERELIANPGLQGKIEFDWVIGTEGSVTSTRVNSSSLASQAVANCIGSAIKTWRFPKPTGGSVSVRYPFVFSVQGF